MLLLAGNFNLLLYECVLIGPRLASTSNSGTVFTIISYYNYEMRMLVGGGLCGGRKKRRENNNNNK